MARLKLLTGQILVCGFGSMILLIAYPLLSTPYSTIAFWLGATGGCLHVWWTASEWLARYLVINCAASRLKR